MIVVAIIGILAAIAIPTYQSHLAETEAATNHLECRNAVKAANIKLLTTPDHDMGETSFGTTNAYVATLKDGAYVCNKSGSSESGDEVTYMCKSREVSTNVMVHEACYTECTLYGIEICSLDTTQEATCPKAGQELDVDKSQGSYVFQKVYQPQESIFTKNEEVEQLVSDVTTNSFFIYGSIRVRYATCRCYFACKGT